MPRTPHPSLKTYEAFLEGMSKESDETKRYFYKQIVWAEKERDRQVAKSQRQREKTKQALKDAEERAAAAEAKLLRKAKVFTAPDSSCEECHGTGHIYICRDLPEAACVCTGGDWTRTGLA
jgi:predicted metallo-beta-lactamase superfamily hydrolase